MSTTPDKSKQVKKAVEKPALTVIPKVIKGDTYLVMADAALEPDDEFVSLYWTSNNTGGIAIKPPFDPKVLKSLVQHNNILGQCVEAMSVNIDGTGHEIVSREEGVDPPEKEVEILKAFFDEPFPGESFVSIRRSLRDDLESVGYGYLEVLRTMDLSLAGFRNIDVSHLRMVRLDAAVQVTKTIMRGGKETQLTYMARERRFVQVLNGTQKLYFKEFGATRDLNRHTGEWATEGKPIDPKDRASEVLMFGLNKDPNSPYYLPRWINNLPSVVGSRKAEEQNLEFFDAGGMPPAIIFIQGGSMVGNSADQLRTYLSAKNRAKGRAIVVELQSSAGTLEASGSVTARVERFGAQQANDAMFSSYDETTEEHVRTSFRLPPLFLGKAADYNFATAQTSYMVAEAQVFQPERREFDQVINKTLVAALGVKDAVLSSMPITLKSADTQLKGIEMLKDKVSPEDYVLEVNKVTGLTLEYDEETQELANARNEALKMTMGQGAPATESKPAEEDKNLSALAKKFAAVCGRSTAFKFDLTAEEQVSVVAEVDALSGERLSKFNELMAAYSSAPAHDHAN